MNWDGTEAAYWHWLDPANASFSGLPQQVRRAGPISTVLFFARRLGDWPQSVPRVSTLAKPVNRK